MLRDCLKVATEAHFLISRGKSFHNLGPAIEKALSPYVFNLLLGVTKYSLHEERKDLECCKSAEFKANLEQKKPQHSENIFCLFYVTEAIDSYLFLGRNIRPRSSFFKGKLCFIASWCLSKQK